MKTVRRLFPGLSAALCVVMLLLLLVDRIRPGLDLFLKEPVKCFVLVVCMAVIASGAVRLADQRRRLRRRLARKKK